MTVDAKHCNLFNADTTTCFVNPERWQPEGGPYTAKAFHRYVDNLAGGDCGGVQEQGGVPLGEHSDERFARIQKPEGQLFQLADV
ncbi:hypothetical protein [Paenibacillus cymbidii]|uniref:hypothetical protein n=1 Tax=Paenibacillus cymbidii TaxID=1639034 RepID=UPI0010804418|nr:hypothetical protein [Paenibacillus cymbidii]